MIKPLVLLAALSLAGCAHSASHDGQMACQPLPGIPDASLLLFGEMHGSAEAPALVADVACALSESRRVAVGLEYPSKDQPLLDAYLASDGAAAGQSKLLDTRFWEKGKDGRSSIAMLQLIERIRQLRNQRHRIELFAFDDQPGTELERNVAIADGIRRFHDAHPGTTIVALMGNVHAMQEPIGSDGEQMLPSGLLLSNLDPVSILVQYPKGTIWACMPDCGVHELEPRTVSQQPPGFKQGASLQGYSHSYLLPSITASRPAIDSSKEQTP